MTKKPRSHKRQIPTHSAGEKEALALCSETLRNLSHLAALFSAAGEQTDPVTGDPTKPALPPRAARMEYPVRLLYKSLYSLYVNLHKGIYDV